MANKYEQDFMEQAGDLSPYVAVTRNKAGFNKVMDDMFRDEINWGTVVGLFVVGSATYVQSFEGGASDHPTFNLPATPNLLKSEDEVWPSES
ncbi:hypothetical protein fugu_019552 [Takifugu bimaculatus]|uniref:Bcl-2 Bcl-2 homology region 1-3 domain-containing protein n=1 Tax=Takifugu bimaculatus TaxID=433685 RepID=A0A4Z2BMS2_9TELE|nr:hypothetical protein fugu_019552 [Takifugu bimaculatus]